MSAARVAVFADNAFEKVNGLTTALTAVLDHAPVDMKVRVYTAATLRLNAPAYLALPSWGIPLPFGQDVRLYWPPYARMREQLISDDAEVVHVATPGPVGLAAVAAARRLGLPLIGSFHSDVTEYTRRRSGSTTLAGAVRRYMTWLYGHCSNVLVPSGSTRQLVVDAGLDESRVSIWSRGVDTTVFRGDRRSYSCRLRMRAPNERPVLLYVGRVSPEKSVDMPPDLHDELMRQGLNHRLVIVGDGPARGDLVRRCPDALCLGTLGREELADIYASADLFVFPSRTDTAGNAVLEAQAAGLPVLVSDAGGPREQMIPGTTGTVCGPALDDWARAARALLTNPAMRRHMGQAARAYAETRPWATTLAPLYATYRSVVVAPTSPGRDVLFPQRVA